MSMISTITWVRRGVAKEIPEKVELDADDLAALMQEKKCVAWRCVEFRVCCARCAEGR